MPASPSAVDIASTGGRLDPARLRRMRNWQSSEFYSRLVMRPVTILIMVVVADWRWLTPNLVTSGANVFKLVGAALIVVDHQHYAISGAILLQVGLLLDHLDGQLARYRKTGSTFGAFYDKVSDAITWLLISGALGWAAYKDTGNVWLPIGALAAAYLMLVLGYMKWIVAAANRQSPATPPQEPPARTVGEWARWLGSSIARAVMFEEVDLFFWIGLGLVLDQLPWTILLLVVSQGAQVVVMCVKRGLQVRAIDAARAPGVAVAATARAA